MRSSQCPVRTTVQAVTGRARRASRAEGRARTGPSSYATRLNITVVNRFEIIYMCRLALGTVRLR